VGQRELEALDKELLDVWAADVVGLLDLNNLEDLRLLVSDRSKMSRLVRTWTSLKRER
jgi:hypothetical protein